MSRESGVPRVGATILAKSGGSERSDNPCRPGVVAGCRAEPPTELSQRRGDEMEFQTRIATIRTLLDVSAVTPAGRAAELLEALNRIQALGRARHARADATTLRALEDEAVGELCELARHPSPEVHYEAEAKLGNGYVFGWLEECSQRSGFVPKGVEGKFLDQALFDSVVLFLEALTGREKPRTAEMLRKRRRRSPGLSRRPSFKTGSGVKPYVATVLRNLLRDHVRSRQQVLVGRMHVGETMAVVRSRLATDGKKRTHLLDPPALPKIRIEILCDSAGDSAGVRRRYRWEPLGEDHVLAAGEHVCFFAAAPMEVPFKENTQTSTATGGCAQGETGQNGTEDGPGVKAARRLRLEPLRDLMNVCRNCLPTVPPQSRVVLEELMTRKMSEVASALQARRTCNSNDPYLVMFRARRDLRAAMWEVCTPRDRLAVAPFVGLFFGKNGADNWALMQEESK